MESVLRLSFSLALSLSRFDDIAQGLTTAGIVEEDLLLVQSRELGARIGNVEGRGHDES